MNTLKVRFLQIKQDTIKQKFRQKPEKREYKCVSTHEITLTNSAVIGLSTINLDNTVLINEIEIEGYGLVKFDRYRIGGGVACFLKNSISCNRKFNSCINTKSVFIEVFFT